jgi:hypothetical protein
MEVREALIDYLRDIAHLEQTSQAGYRQRLTVFAQWVYRLIMHTLSLLETTTTCFGSDTYGMLEAYYLVYTLLTSRQMA